MYRVCLRGTCSPTVQAQREVEEEHRKAELRRKLAITQLPEVSSEEGRKGWGEGRRKGGWGERGEGRVDGGRGEKGGWMGGEGRREGGWGERGEGRVDEGRGQTRRLMHVTILHR